MIAPVDGCKYTVVPWLTTDVDWFVVRVPALVERDRKLVKLVEDVTTK